MPAALVETPHTVAAAEEGKRDVTTTPRALELCLPDAISRTPALPIVGAKAADPGADWQRYGIDPSLSPELLCRQTDQTLTQLVTTLTHRRA
jgi:hypothetical protein